MRAYSMDLQERALLDSDAGMKVADVAAKYRVSGSWVRLLKQRRRETGEVAPRVQRHGRRGMLEPHLHTLADLIAAHPDRTLAELKDALATPEQVAAGALEQPPAANTDRPPRAFEKKIRIALWQWLRFCHTRPRQTGDQQEPEEAADGQCTGHVRYLRKSDTNAKSPRTRDCWRNVVASPGKMAVAEEPVVSPSSDKNCPRAGPPGATADRSVRHSSGVPGARERSGSSGRALSHLATRADKPSMHTTRSIYRGFCFPPEVIAHAVFLYHRFPLSLRDIEDLLAQRGIAVSYETIRRWCRRFGPHYARNVRRQRPTTGCWTRSSCRSRGDVSICGAPSTKTATFSIS